MTAPSAAPTWEEYMAPSLRILANGEVYRARQLVDAAADALGVTDEQRAVVNTSGQDQYRNRGLWALSFLARAGAVDRPTRGHYRITDTGRQLLASHPNGITEKDLREVDGYQTPRRNSGRPTVVAPAQVTTSDDAASLDPEEMIEQGMARIVDDVSDQLLRRLLDNDPLFFEQAVLDLLIAMGYGGTEGRAARTKLSHDGGIDGIIDQDALGLSRIYVQAKRYAVDNPIGREAIQAFVGALAGNQANQGVFITTSRFARTAQDYAGSIATRVILIDGHRLARLMIRYGVGIQVRQRLEIVEIDEDFFE